MNNFNDFKKTAREYFLVDSKIREKDAESLYGYYERIRAYFGPARNPLGNKKTTMEYMGCSFDEEKGEYAVTSPLQRDIFWGTLSDVILDFAIASRETNSPDPFREMDPPSSDKIH